MQKHMSSYTLPMLAAALEDFPPEKLDAASPLARMAHNALTEIAADYPVPQMLELAVDFRNILQGGDPALAKYGETIFDVAFWHSIPGLLSKLSSTGKAALKFAKRCREDCIRRRENSIPEKVRESIDYRFYCESSCRHPGPYDCDICATIREMHGLLVNTDFVVYADNHNPAFLEKVEDK